VRVGCDSDFLIGPNDVVCYDVTYISALCGRIAHHFKCSVNTLGISAVTSNVNLANVFLIISIQIIFLKEYFLNSNQTQMILQTVFN